MAIAYRWDFPVMDVKLHDDGLDNVVTNVHWTYDADDGEGHTAHFYGTAAVPAPAGGFTRYEDLTKSQVQAWVEEALGQEVLSAMNQSAQDQIEAQITPVNAALPAPWA